MPNEHGPPSGLITIFGVKDVSLLSVSVDEKPYEATVRLRYDPSNTNTYELKEELSKYKFIDTVSPQ